MPELYIGLMSGTSLDGVDAILIDLSESRPSITATHFLCFPPAVRAEALALNAAGPDELHRAALFANALAALYADGVREVMKMSGVEGKHVRAIGCHGQTVRHRPELGYTVQLCNAAALAEAVGITVIADFRSRDIAAGGQGAPLAPAFHNAFFRAKDMDRVVLNIGGMANISVLPARGEVLGFDTGPGNILLDAWCERHTGKAYDAEGAWARSGQCVDELLADMLSQPFFGEPPPKSTGRDLFNVEWLVRFRPERYAPADVQATLLELTAASIAEMIQRHCPDTREIFVCGGGAFNTCLLERLQAHVDATLATTAALGLAPEWVEAAAFAWLAQQTLQTKHGNLPEVTGASGPRVLGAIYPA
jgi:anhydro-N-acetylmuramic acid kinase